MVLECEIQFTLLLLNNHCVVEAFGTDNLYRFDGKMEKGAKDETQEIAKKSKVNMHK